MNNENKLCFYEGNQEIESDVLDFLNANKDNCGFDDADIEIIKDFIENGYSVKEQNDEEYSSFLEEADKENQDRPEECMAYLAVSRSDAWTAYVKTGYIYQENGCIATTCSGDSANIIWNDLNDVSSDIPSDASSSTTPADASHDAGIKTKNYTLYYALISAIIAVIIVFLITRLRKKQGYEGIK